MNKNLLCAVSFGALIGFAACGGKVTFQEGNGGEGGSGNAGNSGNSGNVGGTGNAGGSSVSTTASATNGTSTTGTGGGSSLLQACNEFCDETGDCFLPQPCAQQCVQATDPDCAKEFVDVLDCIALGFNPNGCQTQNSCDFEISVWDQCQNGSGDCVTEGCFGGPGGECGCVGNCFGNSYESNCFGGPNGSCDCFTNGNYVGSCPSTPGPDSCDPFAGCCGDIFFGLDGDQPPG